MIFLLWYNEMDQHLEELQKLAKVTFFQMTGVWRSNHVWFASQASMSKGYSKLETDKWYLTSLKNLCVTANSIQQLINKPPFVVFWYSITWKDYWNTPPFPVTLCEQPDFPLTFQPKEHTAIDWILGYRDESSAKPWNKTRLQVYMHCYLLCFGKQLLFIEVFIYNRLTVTLKWIKFWF